MVDTRVPPIQNNTYCPARAPVTSPGQPLQPTVGCQGNASRLGRIQGALSPLPAPTKARTRGKLKRRSLTPPQLRGNRIPRGILGKTALHWAAAVNNARAARSLLQAGADKDAQDSRVSHVAAPTEHANAGESSRLGGGGAQCGAGGHGLGWAGTP